VTLGKGEVDGSGADGFGCL
jgi:hypothetical protein